MRVHNILLLALSIILFNIFVAKARASLEITPLTGDFYIFTTYETFKGTLFPANGMYLVTKQGVVMFDTPWDTTQFQPLLDSIKTKHNKNVIMCIATHSHEDRTGGLAYYQQQGIKTYTTRQTDSICRVQNQKRARFLIAGDTTFTIGNHSFRTYYPGQGHTPDNIVIWFSKEKILYGGCLVKSTEAKDLGNLADANVKAWSQTIQNILNTCPKPRFVIPGHQSWRSARSLQHTLALIEQYKKKSDR